MNLWGNVKAQWTACTWAQPRPMIVTITCWSSYWTGVRNTVNSLVVSQCLSVPSWSCGIIMGWIGQSPSTRHCSSISIMGQPAMLIQRISVTNCTTNRNTPTLLHCLLTSTWSPPCTCCLKSTTPLSHRCPPSTCSSNKKNTRSSTCSQPLSRPPLWIPTSTLNCRTP